MTPGQGRGVALHGALLPAGSLLVGALLLVSCGGGPPRRVPLSSGPTAPATDVPAAEASVAKPTEVNAGGLDLPRGLPQGGPIGAEVLAPDPDLADAVVARVDGTEVRRSHVYHAFATIKPELAEQVLDMVVGDVLMAGHARQYGITVPAERIEARVDQELEVLRQGVESQYEGAVSFADYLQASFALDLDGFRRQVRRRQAIFALRGLVIRYLALRDGQVEVRVLRHKDRELVAELRRKAAGGADFASMVRQHSQDPSRMDGGLLPPFGPGFEHPVAPAALALEPGGLTPVITAPGEDGDDHYLAMCLRREDGQELPYREVAEELWRGLLDRPLSAFEFNAYLLRFRSDAQVELPRGTSG